MPACLSSRCSCSNFATHFKVDDAMTNDVPFIKLHISEYQIYFVQQSQIQCSQYCKLKNCTACSLFSVWPKIKLNLEGGGPNFNQTSVHHFQLLSIGHFHNLSHTKALVPIQSTQVPSLRNVREIKTWTCLTIHHFDNRPVRHLNNSSVDIFEFEELSVRQLNN